MSPQKPAGDFAHDAEGDELEDDPPRRKNKAKGKVGGGHVGINGVQWDQWDRVGLSGNNGTQWDQWEQWGSMGLNGAQRDQWDQWGQ